MVDPLAGPLPGSETTTMSDETCGAWGGCPLPKGHNMGNADVPSNHQAPVVIDWRALADDLFVDLELLRRRHCPHEVIHSQARYREARQQ